MYAQRTKRPTSSLYDMASIFRFLKMPSQFLLAAWTSDPEYAISMEKYGPMMTSKKLFKSQNISISGVARRIEMNTIPQPRIRPKRELLDMVYP